MLRNKALINAKYRKKKVKFKLSAGKVLLRVYTIFILYANFVTPFRMTKLLREARQTRRAIKKYETTLRRKRKRRYIHFFFFFFSREEESEILLSFVARAGTRVKDASTSPRAARRRSSERNGKTYLYSIDSADGNRKLAKGSRDSPELVETNAGTREGAGEGDGYGTWRKKRECADSLFLSRDKSSREGGEDGNAAGGGPIRRFETFPL